MSIQVYYFLEKMKLEKVFRRSDKGLIDFYGIFFTTPSINLIKIKWSKSYSSVHCLYPHILSYNKYQCIDNSMKNASFYMILSAILANVQKYSLHLLKLLSSHKQFKTNTSAQLMSLCEELLEDHFTLHPNIRHIEYSTRSPLATTPLQD